MTIEFYFMAPSAPCRAVWMTMKELKLEFEPKHVDILQSEHSKPEFLAINPRGNIPAIKDGDYALSESRAISAYLCNQYEKGDDATRLYPVDPKARGIVDKILYVSEATYDQIQAYVSPGRVIFRGQKPSEEKLSGVHRALAIGEEYLRNNVYMAGDHLTLADLFMFSPLLLLDFPEFDDYDKYPRTIDWMKKMKSLPYFDECNKKALDNFKNAYQEALKILKS